MHTHTLAQYCRPKRILRQLTKQRANIATVSAGNQKSCMFRVQPIKAKFHYAVVRSWSATSFEPVWDQLRTSFEPASVMEFGFNEAGSWLTPNVSCAL